MPPTEPRWRPRIHSKPSDPHTLLPSGRAATCRSAYASHGRAGARELLAAVGARVGRRYGLRLNRRRACVASVSMRESSTTRGERPPPEAAVLIGGSLSSSSCGGNRARWRGGAHSVSLPPPGNPESPPPAAAPPPPSRRQQLFRRRPRRAPSSARGGRAAAAAEPPPRGRFRPLSVACIGCSGFARSRIE